MSIVVNAAPNVWVQGACHVGYDNLFLRADAVLVANVEDVGQTGDLAASWLTYSGGWQATGAGDKTLAVSFSSAEAGNSFGIYKHNLGTLGLTVKVQHSSDGSTWVDLTGSEQSPPDDEAIFFVGASVSRAYWRIHITGLAAGETLIVGQAFVGPALQIFSPPEDGFTPPQFGLNSQFVMSRSDGGDFLGRSLIRKGSKSGFKISNVAEAWVKANWLPFIKEAEKHPFYFAWDSVGHFDEVAFCYTGKKIAPPTYQSSLFFALSLEFTALLE